MIAITTLLTAFLAGGVLIALISNFLLLNFSRNLGIRNKNDVIVRWSNQSKPSLGGISFFVAFIFGAIAYAILAGDQNIFQNLQYVGFMLSGSLAFLMGLADDAFNTRPLIKLIVQISCGLLLSVTGTNIHLFHYFIPDMLVTVIWVVIIMNSLNMLDNMDGITATTVFFILCACLVNSWIFNGIYFDLWIQTLIVLLGALMGFLRYNIHPAKIFMGDAGSQFIGLVVAFFAINSLWNIPDYLTVSSWYSIPIVLVAFSPAASDTLSVVINRLRRGQSPMVGGKDHTTHHLVYAGRNDLQVWLIFALIGLFAFLLTGLIVYFLRSEMYLAVVLTSLYFPVVFLYLYRNTRKFSASR